MAEQVDISDLPTPDASIKDLPAPPEKPTGGDTFLGSAARMVGKGAINTLFFIPDIATEIGNLPSEKYFGPKMELPSSYWGKKLDQLIKPPSSKVARGLEEVGGMLVGGIPGMERGVSQSVGRGVRALEPTVTKELNRVTTRAAEEAHSAGYNLPPKYIGGPIRKELQTLGGGPKVDVQMAKGNMEVTDRLAKLSLGLHPSEELNSENLTRLKEDAYKEYEAVRDLGKIPADPAFDEAVKKAGGRFAEVGQSYGGGSRYASILEEKQRYLGTQEVDAGETLDEIRALRKASSANLKNYNPEANALGMTQREIAKAMEDRIERAATSSGNTNLVTNLKDARTRLAKIFNVEDAIGAGGHVDAHDFKRLKDAGVPLTDGLLTIADTATHFGDAVKNVTQKGETGTWSAIDYLLGGTGIVSGHPVISSLAIARPIMRAAIETEGAQKSMIRNLGKKPGVVSKTTSGTIKAAKPAARAIGRGALIRGSELMGESDLGKDNGP